MAKRALGVAVLLALIGAVAWQVHSDNTEVREHTLTAIDPGTVRRIDITMKGLPPQHFEKQGDGWTGNDQGRPTELAQLAETPVGEWKSVEGFDLAKIGLAPPLAVLTLDGTRIEYGDMAALGRQRYARVGDRIAFIAAQAMPRAPRTKALDTKPM